MAPPRKSHSEHALQGTTPRYNDGESHVAGALPKPPKFLSKESRKKFKAMVRQLAERRAVTAGDGELLAVYCSTHERWLQALEAIRKDGVVVTYKRSTPSGEFVDVEKPNISLKIAEVAERAMVGILTKLGLTPRDRDSVRPTSEAKPKGPQPPSPGSERWLADEADRLRAEIAAAPAEEPEPDLDKILEAADDEIN
jgi:P27 family predicted phage terminase small subunit